MSFTQPRKKFNKNAMVDHRVKPKKNCLQEAQSHLHNLFFSYFQSEIIGPKLAVSHLENFHHSMRVENLQSPFTKNSAWYRIRISKAQMRETALKNAIKVILA